MCNCFNIAYCKHNPQPDSQGVAETIARVTRRQFLSRAALSTAALAAAPMLLAPDAAHADLFGRPSVDDQKKAGLQAEQDVLKQYKLVNDSRTVELKAVGARLVNALQEPDRSRWNYDFHLIESKELNAFALPGGPLFFFTGLYDDFTTEDELAGVVGHEMTHVRLEHWAKAYQNQQKNDVLAMGLGALFHNSSAAQSVIGFGDQAMGLKYSRGEEAQADHGGLEDMTAAGYNPQGMIDMFNVLLSKAGNGGGGLSGDFLSNHPLTTDRIKAAQGQIASLKQDQGGFPQQRPIGTSARQG